MPEQRGTTRQLAEIRAFLLDIFWVEDASAYAGGKYATICRQPL